MINLDQVNGEAKGQDKGKTYRQNESITLLTSLCKLIARIFRRENKNAKITKIYKFHTAMITHVREGHDT